jgi:hypothetical protein
MFVSIGRVGGCTPIKRRIRWSARALMGRVEQCPSVTSPVAPFLRPNSFRVGCLQVHIAMHPAYIPGNSRQSDFTHEVCL